MDTTTSMAPAGSEGALRLRGRPVQRWPRSCRWWRRRRSRSRSPKSFSGGCVNASSSATKTLRFGPYSSSWRRSATCREGRSSRGSMTVRACARCGRTTLAANRWACGAHRRSSSTEAGRCSTATSPRPSCMRRSRSWSRGSSQAAPTASPAEELRGVLGENTEAHFLALIEVGDGVDGWAST